MVQTLRSVTGALSVFGLALALLRLAAFVFSRSSVVQRDGRETTRNVAALGAVASTLTICLSFIRL